MFKQILLGLCSTLFAYGSIAMATAEPPHTAILTVGKFEIREYPSLIAAEVTVPVHAVKQSAQDSDCSPATSLVAIRHDKVLR